MEIKVPSVGESVFEALIARWLKKDGEQVAKDEPLCEIETDKITLEVTAEADGVLHILVPEVETVKIGAVIGTIEEGATAETAPPAGEPAPPKPPVEEPKPTLPPVKEPPSGPEPPMSPSGRKLAREMGMDAREVKGSGRGGRVTVEDLQKAASAGPEPALTLTPAVKGSGRSQAREAAATAAPPAPAAAAAPPSPAPAPAPAPPSSEEGRITRKAMPPIRKRIAERLVAARLQTAMLTTFNEADMSKVIELRKQHGDFFLKRHQVKLGFMSLFVRACCQALKDFPEVNASIEGDDVVYHHYCDIGVAVGGEKGLVVPVLRSADRMTLAQIEQQIAEFGEKIRTNRLAVSDLEGGTFTVSNGGIYGSLLSTPILNTPQSGVLGMHAIQDRAVVRDGQIVIRPMMYLALSYDHRLVDGKGAVGFLKQVKEYIEEPEEMLLEG
ncbi:dihydrolipoyllysine-residue succinyltransferase component of 2-oxoglutarate dehydrogenase complex [Geomonas sp. Red276]